MGLHTQTTCTPTRPTPLSEACNTGFGGCTPPHMLRRTVLGSSRAPGYQRDLLVFSEFFRMTEKGGVGSRAVALMMVLAVLTVLAVLDSTLPSFCLSYKMQCQETTMMV